MRKILLFIFLVCFSVANLNAAKPDKNTKTTKTEKPSEAKTAFDSGDYELAAKKLETACQNDDYGACHNIGIMQLEGNGVEIDPAKARLNFIKGCSNGVMQSCFSLGLLYENGLGVEVDKFKAFEYFQKSCQSKEAVGCDRVGKFYEEGEAVRFDIKKALEIYDKHCMKDKGFASCMRLGEIYLKGTEEIKIDAPKGINYLEVACNGAFKDSCEIISRAYFNGVECKFDKNDENLVKDSNQTSKNSKEPEKTTCVGVKKDIELALKYLDISCTNGTSESCIELGLHYLNGTIVKSDMPKAKEYFGKACDMKNANGCKSYKMMIKEGH